MEDAAGSGRRTRTRGAEAAAWSAALERLRAIRDARAQAAATIQVKVDAPIYDTVAEDYAALVARRRKDAGEFIVVVDGLGYVKDGRADRRMTNETETTTGAVVQRRTHAWMSSRLVAVVLAGTDARAMHRAPC